MATATAVTEPGTISGVTNDPAAHALLRAGHDTGYRFPIGFAGFAATVYFRDGAASATGRVEVRSPRDLALTIDADEAGQTWLKQEIASIAGHRWPTPYEAADGRWTLTLGDDADHPLGRTVLVHGDPFGSSYRVRDGRISQVHRRMGPTRFTITILAHATTPDGRTLPSAFTVAYWEVAAEHLTRADAYNDRYLEIDGIMLPAGRRVVSFADGGQTVRELVLSDHALLTGEAVAGAHDAERAGTRAG
jgi:hypothetical protein